MNTPTENSAHTLTVAARELHDLTAQLFTHTKNAKDETDRLMAEIGARQNVLALAEAGIDHEKIALARTVVYAGPYANGGSERASVIKDAVQQLATGTPIGNYANLWTSYFATKNYDRWSGQRSDHTYGYGPRHGSICFEVGLCSEVRQREPKALTPEETEAAIYFLLNLERIQQAEKGVA